MSKPGRVREPVQVYLDRKDRELLDAAAERASLSRAEVLRVALRRFAAELPGTARRGSAIDMLIGIIDDPDGPTDISVRHDDYLAEALTQRKLARPRRKK